MTVSPKPNHERNPLEELAGLAGEEGGQGEEVQARMEASAGGQALDIQASSGPGNICDHY